MQGTAIAVDVQHEVKLVKLTTSSLARRGLVSFPYPFRENLSARTASPITRMINSRPVSDAAYLSRPRRSDAPSSPPPSMYRTDNLTVE